MSSKSHGGSSSDPDQNLSQRGKTGTSMAPAAPEERDADLTDAEYEQFIKDLQLTRLRYVCSDSGEVKVQDKDGVDVPHYCTALKERVREWLLKKDKQIITRERIVELLKMAQQRMQDEEEDPAANEDLGKAGRKKKRGPYRCGRCRMFKKGHKCKYAPKKTPKTTKKQSKAKSKNEGKVLTIKSKKGTQLIQVKKGNNQRNGSGKSSKRRESTGLPKLATGKDTESTNKGTLANTLSLILLPDKEWRLVYDTDQEDPVLVEQSSNSSAEEDDGFETALVSNLTPL